MKGLSGVHVMDEAKEKQNLFEKCNAVQRGLNQTSNNSKEDGFHYVSCRDGYIVLSVKQTRERFTINSPQFSTVVLAQSDGGTGSD
jgi:hypothetical protein